MNEDLFMIKGLENIGGPESAEMGSSLDFNNWRSFFPEIIGRSPSMSKVLENSTKIARTESAVLILGESGTGKELIAAAIHRLSKRADKRFMAINCSAIPEDLLESELFGYEQGAFTGANKRRAGFFEVAKGGTIFLDEIGEMPKRLQAKLLRVLQEKKFTPLGGSEEKSADARIIAATNIDLDKAVQANEFRLDLFYRLNVFPITLPPLRERGEDVELLIEHYLKVANRIHNIHEDCYFNSEVLTCLNNYPWPGNVRQLQNLVERLVVISGGGQIQMSNLPPEMLIKQHIPSSKNNPTSKSNETGINPPYKEQTYKETSYKENDLFLADKSQVEPSRDPMRPLTLNSNNAVVYPHNFSELPSQGIDLNTYISELENHFINEALRKTGNNKNQAAQLLGLNRTTLVERIKKRKIRKLNAASQEL
ncbi:MAG: sigma 54-interacting transcriptional regulator [Oligoflexales bacterium]|nr:sigma 54-interacting transcriptional regulator [Oligoflexales bacterium]